MALAGVTSGQRNPSASCHNEHHAALGCWDVGMEINQIRNKRPAPLETNHTRLQTKIKHNREVTNRKRDVSQTNLMENSVWWGKPKKKQSTILVYYWVYHYLGWFRPCPNAEIIGDSWIFGFPTSVLVDLDPFVTTLATRQRRLWRPQCFQTDALASDSRWLDFNGIKLVSHFSTCLPRTSWLEVRSWSLHALPILPFFSATN